MGNLIRYKLHKLYSCLAYATPLGILFAINHKAYISIADGSVQTGATIGFFGYILLGFMALGFKSKVLEFAKKNTLLSISIGVFIIAVVMEFLARQLMLISGASIIGAILSNFFEPVADVYYARCYEHSGDKRIRKNTITLTAKDAWKQAYGFRL